MKPYLVVQIQRVTDSMNDIVMDLLGTFAPLIITAVALYFIFIIYIKFRKTEKDQEDNNSTPEKVTTGKNSKGFLIEEKSNYTIAWVLIIGVALYIGGDMLYTRLGFSPVTNKTSFSCSDGKELVSSNWYRNLKNEYVLVDLDTIITEKHPCNGLIKMSTKKKIE